MATKREITKMKNANARAARAALKAIQIFEDGMAEAGHKFVKNDIEYVVDSRGRVVRQPSKDHPVTREDVIYLLKGLRAVGEEEALELIGRGVTNFLLEHGFVKRDARIHSLLWVTKKGGTVTNLPRQVTGGEKCNFH